MNDQIFGWLALVLAGADVAALFVLGWVLHRDDLRVRREHEELMRLLAPRDGRTS